MNPTLFFKCLADNTRLKILMLINREQELCVCELMVALDESQPKISRHLALLKKSGLLIDRKQSLWVYYRINPALLTWSKDVIDYSTINNADFISTNLNKLQIMGDRPQRLKSCCNDQSVK